MQKKTIVEKVRIHPSQCTNKLNEKLHEILSKKLVNKVTEANGHIIDVENDFKIMNNSILDSGDIELTVKLSINTILLKEGDVFKGNVVMVFDLGIMVGIENNDEIKIFIASEKMKGYEYDYNDGDDRFIKQKKRKLKVIDDETKVTIQIEAVQFSNNRFDWLGCLKKVHSH